MYLTLVIAALSNSKLFTIFKCDFFTCNNENYYLRKYQGSRWIFRCLRQCALFSYFLLLLLQFVYYNLVNGSLVARLLPAVTHPSCRTLPPQLISIASGQAEQTVVGYTSSCMFLFIYIYMCVCICALWVALTARTFAISRHLANPRNLKRV